MTARILFAFVPLLALASCGPSPAFEPDAPPQVAPERDEEWTAPADDLVMPFAIGQMWAGTYTCPQGLTGAELHIVHIDGPVVEAEFGFHHDASGARGLFRMTGTYDAPRRSLRLEPGEWIQRPPGYVSVPIVGRVSPNGRRYMGKIEARDCGQFLLRLLRRT